MCEINKLKYYVGRWRVVGVKAHIKEHHILIHAVDEKSARNLLIRILETETGNGFDPVQMIIRTEEGYLTNIRVEPYNISE